MQPYGMWIVDLINAKDYFAAYDVWEAANPSQIHSQGDLDDIEQKYLGLFRLFDEDMKILNQTIPFRIDSFLQLCSRPWFWMKMRLHRIRYLQTLWRIERERCWRLEMRSPRNLLQLILDDF